MDNPRLLHCEPRSLQRSPDSQREGGNHALRCVPSLSLKLSPTLRGLCCLHAPLRPGASPWTRLRSTAPQSACNEMALESKISHELMTSML